MKKKYKITKKELYNLYWNKNLNPQEIADKFKCSYSTIKYRLKIYNIKLKTRSEAGKGTHSHEDNKNPNFKDGRSLKKYYCKCGKEISIYSGVYGQGKCKSCANKMKCLSEKTKKKIGKAVKGEKNGFYGRKHTKESREKIKKNHVSFFAEKNSNFKHGLYSKTNKFFNKCIICDKKISPQAIKCCSCNKIGPDNPNWNNGSSLEEYGAKFDNDLKEQVRFRDGYKCQICGCSQLENGRQLDCHHCDYNKKHNKLNNLVSLCRKCHSRTNGNRKHWKKYFKKIMRGKINVEI